MNDAFTYKKHRNGDAYPYVHWVKRTTPTIRVRIKSERYDRSQELTDASVDVNNPRHVKDLLRRVVLLGKMIAVELGIPDTFEPVTDRHVNAYLGGWRDTSAERYGVMYDQMRKAEASYIAPAPRLTEYVPSPMIDSTSRAIQAVLARYEGRDGLFTYTNVYGDPARVPML